MKHWVVICKAEIDAETADKAREALLKRHPALWAFDCSEVRESDWQPEYNCDGSVKGES